MRMIFGCKDYASPVLLLGDGVLQESRLSPGETHFASFSTGYAKLSMHYTSKQRWRSVLG